MITEKTASGISYAGGATSVLSALTLTDVGIIVGIASALITLGFNIVYQRRRDKREAEAHELRLEAIRRNPDRRGGTPPNGCGDNPPPDCPFGGA